MSPQILSTSPAIMALGSIVRMQKNNAVPSSPLTESCHPFLPRSQTRSCFLELFIVPRSPINLYTFNCRYTWPSSFETVQRLHNDGSVFLHHLPQMNSLLYLHFYASGVHRVLAYNGDTDPAGECKDCRISHSSL